MKCDVCDTPITHNKWMSVWPAGQPVSLMVDTRHHYCMEIFYAYSRQAQFGRQDLWQKRKAIAEATDGE